MLDLPKFGTQQMTVILDMIFLIRLISQCTSLIQLYNNILLILLHPLKPHSWVNPNTKSANTAQPNPNSQET